MLAFLGSSSAIDITLPSHNLHQLPTNAMCNCGPANNSFSFMALRTYHEDTSFKLHQRLRSPLPNLLHPDNMPRL
ncbi:hypothetical protein PIB30_108760, partial [Stylosanthes scabra]|nr:hypothetical protein [Stylosanthes scabra]